MKRKHIIAIVVAILFLLSGVLVYQKLPPTKGQIYNKAKSFVGNKIKTQELSNEYKIQFDNYNMKESTIKGYYEIRGNCMAYKDGSIELKSYTYEILIKAIDKHTWDIGFCIIE